MGLISFAFSSSLMLSTAFWIKMYDSSKKGSAFCARSGVTRPNAALMFSLFVASSAAARSFWSLRSSRGLGAGGGVGRGRLGWGWVGWGEARLGGAGRGGVKWGGVGLSGLRREVGDG